MQELDDLFKKYFLEYTSYVVKYRAIPYIEDGLKPVQRRIMQTLIDLDNGAMHKVANVVGQTMRYHPHGDSSIYEALVNLTNAKYFIEGAGDFGNIYTGSRAAAPRYIECRILRFAKEVLYSPEITQYVPTYDSRFKEPVVFPAKLPMVLLLGGLGIVPGMTCKIFPHNPVEVVDCMKRALKDQDFEIYPDLPTGGIIDVSNYDDGKGSISIRSKVDIDEKNRKLIIREIPYTITTETLVEDIDKAGKAGKLHIASIFDFTSKDVNIEIEIQKGDFNLQNELTSLFAYTNAEVTIKDLSPMIIVNKHPVIMGVSEIIKFHSRYLVQILLQELGIEKEHLYDKLQLRTLERIFIEERIYKIIETLKSEEEIYSQLKASLMRFKDEFARELRDEDIDHLLKLPIRRISLFDIEKNKKDIIEISKAISENDDKRNNIKKYAVDTLDRLLTLIPKDISLQRKSQISVFSTISHKDIDKAVYTLRYDSKTGYIGYGVKGGDELFEVTEGDKILIVKKSGEYHVVQIQSKYYVGKDFHSVYLADKDNLKNIIFTIIFEGKINKVTMIKRCIIKQFIMNKPYSLLPDGEYKALSIITDEEGLLTIEYKSGRNPCEQVYLSEFLVKNVSSQGVQLTKREVRKIKFKKTELKDTPPKKEELNLFSQSESENTSSETDNGDDDYID